MKKSDQQEREICNGRAKGTEVIPCIQTLAYLNAYIQGEIDRIEELEEPVLDPLCRNEMANAGPICHNNWSMAVSTNVI